jgi:ABC-type amino acid transport substrate-binding protein
VTSSRSSRATRSTTGIEVDIAGTIDLALEQARVRFTAHGWQATLVELAAERAWLVANRAAF